MKPPCANQRCPTCLVWDQGVGSTRRTRDRMFPAALYTTKAQGLGMGLSIVQVCRVRKL
jgi:C4-dicarboxylate-specific signal transduction histidine kinase